jgi:hypothetical protein
MRAPGEEKGTGLLYDKISATAGRMRRKRTRPLQPIVGEGVLKIKDIQIKLSTIGSSHGWEGYGRRMSCEWEPGAIFLGDGSKKCDSPRWEQGVGVGSRDRE